MSADPNQVRQAIQKAREALLRSDKAEARRWAEQAVRLAPELEDAWLLMAAVSGPRASLEYAKRALVIHPESERARKAVEWARKRADAESSTGRIETPPPAQSQIDAPTPARNRRWMVYALLLSGLVCVVVALAGWTASQSPALASILQTANEPLPTATPETNYARVEIAKPTYTPEWTSTPTVTPSPTFTPTPSVTPTPEWTSTPLPTDTPLPTETPGVMEVAIVPDTPTPERPPTRAAPTQAAYAQPGGGNGIRWIDINLSAQRLYAYEGDVMVNAFIVSTGTWQYPTVTGSYKIYVKYLSTTMTGPGYNLPNVPYTMYFHRGYGIHGTYWHSNFGTPMSHGCVNLSIPDAEWLYYWASVGTVVNIHY